MSCPRCGSLWDLADQLEGKVRDKRHVGPLERYILKEVWTELTKRLGERM